MVNNELSTRQGRARSAEKERFWRRHLSRHARSQRTVRDYCAQAGISEPSFYAWRSELVRRDSETSGPAPSGPAAAGHRAISGPAFLPVTIASTVLHHVEVVLPSGVVIRIPAQDGATLRTVLELLESRTC